MPERIESLTQAQKDAIPEWVSRWVAKGLCTDPADRDTFRSGVDRCYRFADLEPPKQIVWVGSPIVAVLAGPIADYCLTQLRTSPVAEWPCTVAELVTEVVTPRNGPEVAQNVLTAVETVLAPYLTGTLPVPAA